MKPFITFLILLISAPTLLAQTNAEIAFEIQDKNIITEAITYSKNTNHFYIGNILDTKIIKIDANTGEASDLMASDVVQMRFCGMVIDEKKNHLYTCGGITIDGRRTTAVAKIDILNGKLVDLYPAPDTLFRYAFNDVALDKKGNLYVTCTNNHHVFRIDRKTNKIELFYADEEMDRPNGISISDNQKYLYLNCRNGIRILDISKKELVNDAYEFNSITHDGLKFYKNTLIAVKHFWPKHKEANLYQYQLNKKGTKIIGSKILVKDHPLFALPTYSVIKDDVVYLIATSYLHNADWANNTFKDESLKGNIIILKHPLTK